VLTSDVGHVWVVAYVLVTVFEAGSSDSIFALYLSELCLTSSSCISLDPVQSSTTLQTSPAALDVKISGRDLDRWYIVKRLDPLTLLD
jgi:hypothetical protein